MKESINNPVMSEGEHNEKIRILVVVSAVLAIVLIVIVAIYFRYGNRNDSKNIAQIPVSTPGDAQQEISPIPIPTLSFVPGQLMVKFKKGQSLDEITDETLQQEVLGAFTEARVLRQENVYDSKDPELRTYKMLLLEQGADIERAKEILSELDNVEDVSENLDNNSISQ